MKFETDVITRSGVLPQDQVTGDKIRLKDKIFRIKEISEILGQDDARTVFSGCLKTQKL